MLGDLTTEGRNPASEAIDTLSALEIVRLINAEDAKVAEAVARQFQPIAQAVEIIAARLGSGGRLVYLGAGTSGRLGVLDAAECPPTFNTDPAQVVGIIAGGAEALVRAVEGAEDLRQVAVEDLKAVGLCDRDVLLGIATSGRTPYVLAGLEYAAEQGAYRIGLSCNRDAALTSCCDLTIIPIVGPEVISGSTRLKAGTATKLVLNILTTASMVLLGKTYGNLMVDLRATSSKLVDRSRRIVTALTGQAGAEAEALLARCGGEVKTAVVSQLCRVTPEEARQRLARVQGHLRRALHDQESGSQNAECRMKKAEGSGSKRLPLTEHQSSTINHQSSISIQHSAFSIPLLLGIDGGGTKTVAWLARCEAAGDLSVIGRGTAGAANPQTVGFTVALENLDRAVAAAFDDAAARGAIARAGDQEPGTRGQGPGGRDEKVRMQNAECRVQNAVEANLYHSPIINHQSSIINHQLAFSIQHSPTAAVLALAGSDRDENRSVLKRWAAERRLAGSFHVVHDALPVLAAGSPDGWGVALIAGTGSLAFGQAPDGRTARTGGWGFRFGDEGSGYALAVAGLRAAAKSADGRGPTTRLLQGLLDRLGLREPAELIPTISRPGADPAAIAALAHVVTQTADQGDVVAQQIVGEAAGELAGMVAAVVRRLDLPAAAFPLALAGGALLGSENLQRCLSTHLGLLGLLPDPVVKVPEPVLGAVKLAQQWAVGSRQ
jgi:N-acetylmuramic acid 6-phosphate etherase